MLHECRKCSFIFSENFEYLPYKRKNEESLVSILQNRKMEASSSKVSADDRTFRPRQFEYHPSNSSLMVFGTLDGEVVAMTHESEKIVSYIPSLGAMNSVLGLSWLKKYPSKVVLIGFCFDFKV
ncbi:hypothetical protein DCAR_0520471 [Daucus carota subsp. sativus]|uniref:Uncharacterized protein n=1 Tax=Daucus carota subsp. sativus TaxID=79200 RepID=A0AAF0X619_DAUCS|nr:hypothetical protein DCAR_0520471 [Daucus carota subsp. sativus]